MIAELTAAVDRQTAAIVEAIGQRQAVAVTAREVVREVMVEAADTPATPAINRVAATSAGTDNGDFIEFEGKLYSRETTPKWFVIVDWLNAERFEWSLSAISKETGVSRPYISSAKRYWQANNAGTAG